MNSRSGRKSTLAASLVYLVGRTKELPKHLNVKAIRSSQSESYGRLGILFFRNAAVRHEKSYPVSGFLSENIKNPFVQRALAPAWFPNQSLRSLTWRADWDMQSVQKLTNRARRHIELSGKANAILATTIPCSNLLLKDFQLSRPTGLSRRDLFPVRRCRILGFNHDMTSSEGCGNGQDRDSVGALSRSVYFTGRCISFNVSRQSRRAEQSW
jgi:hypothetical protein